MADGVVKMGGVCDTGGVLIERGSGVDELELPRPLDRRGLLRLFCGEGEINARLVA